MALQIKRYFTILYNITFYIVHINSLY